MVGTSFLVILSFQALQGAYPLPLTRLATAHSCCLFRSVGITSYNQWCLKTITKSDRCLLKENTYSVVFHRIRDISSERQRARYLKAFILPEHIPLRGNKIAVCYELK